MFCGHPQADFGVLAVERAYARHQPQQRERRIAIQGQRAFGAFVFQPRQRKLELIEGSRNRDSQLLAFFSKHQATRQTTKKRDAKAIFELANLLADGALGEMKFGRSLGEAKGPGGRFKTAKP